MRIIERYAKIAAYKSMFLKRLGYCKSKNRSFWQNSNLKTYAEIRIEAKKPPHYSCSKSPKALGKQIYWAFRFSILILLGKILFNCRVKFSLQC